MDAHDIALKQEEWTRGRFHLSHGEGVFTRYIQDARNRLSMRYLYGKRVLDVGCHSGYLRKLLPTDVTYVGIDIHPPAKADFEYHNRSVNDDLSDLGKFDSIFMLATIEHLDDYHQAIANLVPLLNQGGRLILTTPSRTGDALHHWGAKVGLVSMAAAEDHEKIFTLDELKELITHHHLQLTHAQTFMLGLNQLVVGEKK